MASKSQTIKNNIVKFFFIAFILFGIIIIPILNAKNSVEELTKLKKENAQLKVKAKKLSENSKIINDIENKILKLNPNLNLITVHNYASLVNEYCSENIQIPMIAILRQESNFKTTAKNKHGDYGLGQINWSTWNKFFDLKEPRNLFDPALNIKLSCKILEMAYIAHRDKENWWSYYHSWNTIPREKYIKSVNKFLKEIK